MEYSLSFHGSYMPALQWLHHLCNECIAKCVLLLLVLRLFLKTSSRVSQKWSFIKLWNQEQRNFLLCWHKSSLLACLALQICCKSSKNMLISYLCYDMVQNVRCVSYYLGWIADWLGSGVWLFGNKYTVLPSLVKLGDKSS